MDYGMIKKYTYKEVDENGQEVEKTLTFKCSFLTLKIYKNYVGTDLLADMANIAKTAGKTNITADSTVADIADSDLDVMANMSPTITFYAQLLAAMICTARRNENLDFEEVLDSLPMNILMDGDFMSEILQLVTFGLKKK